jgi:hypothetical protein
MKKLIPFAALALFACAEPAPEGGDLEPVISPLPASVFLGTEVPLDASETRGGAFNLTWRVEEPAGCDRSAPLGPTDVATTFEALCVGVHTVRLEVTPVGGGDELRSAEATFEVVLPEGFLSVSVANIDEAFIGEDARVTLDFDDSLVPAALIGEELIEATVTLVENATTDPTVSVDENDGKVLLVNMAEAHATYDIDIRLSLADGELVSETPLSVSLTTLNSNPEVATIDVTPFGPGEATTVTGAASDADGDTVTCALVFAADNVGPEFALPGPDTSGDCTFTFTPPDGLLAWRIEIVATDEFGGTDDDANGFVLTPNNAPPAIEALAVGDRVEVGYSCTFGDPPCQSDQVTIDIVATDDIDAADALTYEIVEVTAPEGAGRIDIVENSLGNFTIFAQRNIVGPVAGEYGIEVRVTEATSAVGLDPSTAVEELTVAVQNTTPAIANINAPAAAHSFSQGSQTYLSTLQVDFTVSDPEANADGAVRIVGCPSGAAVTADGCGEVTFDAVEKAGTSVTFELSSTTIGAIVGVFNLEVTATDADGASSTAPIAIEVLNSAPVVADLSPVQQQFVGSNTHRAVLVAYEDPDGDPLFGVDTVNCPTGTCSGTVSINADGSVVIESAPVAAFLGAYEVGGATVTDGLENVFGTRTIEVVNSTPTLAVNAGASTASRNHKTVAGTVSVDPADGSAFPFVGDATDANGDPLTLTPIQTDVVPDQTSFAPGAINVEYDIVTSYATFQSRFLGAGFTATFKVVDPFGAESTVRAASPTYLNRLPINTSTSMSFSDGNGGDALRIHHINGIGFESSLRPDIHDGNATARELGIHRPACTFTPCDAFIPVDVVTVADDPDGDPLEMQHTFNCVDFGSLSMPSPTFNAFNQNATARLGVDSVELCTPLDEVIFVKLVNDVLSCNVSGRVRDVDTSRSVSAGSDNDTISTSQSGGASICF